MIGGRPTGVKGAAAVSKAPRAPQARRDWGQDDSQTPILHLDMDCFFAAVEVLDNPRLAGGPVIVGGGGNRGVVSAANYEARAFGVSSAMPISQARRRCPHGTFLPVRMSRYREISAQVMSILRAISPAFEQLSVDEAFLDVSGARLRLGSPVQIGQSLREQIRREVGLPASVGIGKNKLVAKLASAHAKPDGLLLIPAPATQDFLRELPLEALWGIGGATRTRLHNAGIDSVAELAQTPPARLVRIFGSALGRHLHEIANGIDDRAVSPEREEKSLGTEQTFAENLYERRQLELILLRQAHECASGLRRRGLVARRVSIKVRDGYFETVTRSQALPEPTNLAADLNQAALTLLRKLRLPPSGVRLLGLRAEGLLAASSGRQLALDGDERQEKTEAAMDQVALRFGKNALLPASLVGSGKASTAPLTLGKDGDNDGSV